MTLRPPVPTDIAVLRGLAASARCVLFDFDGPLVGLFANHPAPGVARVLKERLREWGELTPAMSSCDDPLEVIRAFAHHPRTEELEKLLTDQEIHAASLAVPAPHSDELVRLLVDRGRQVAVTTNNSPQAASHYLAGRGLEELFGPHIYGRTQDPALMKPDPHCLNCAMEKTGHEPADCLMIGDSVSDYVAAEEAGVTFLGYARRAEKEADLRAAGAEFVIDSLELLCSAARDV